MHVYVSTFIHICNVGITNENNHKKQIKTVLHCFLDSWAVSRAEAVLKGLVSTCNKNNKVFNLKKDLPGPEQGWVTHTQVYT